MAIRDDHLAAMVDEALARDTARRAGDWPEAIRRARGAEALLLLRDHGDDLPDEEYWRTLGAKHREAGELHLAQFADLYLSKRAGREHIMMPDDRLKLAAMAERFPVWRGGRCPLDDLLQGFSWTTDRETAVWYATGYRASVLTGPPHLLRATCSRTDVIGYFSDRDESEVLASPDLLRDVAEEPI